MGENSAIEWTTHTFNPWIGCTKVAPGCAHCYAEVLMDHRYGKAEWGPSGTRVMTSPGNWAKPHKWNRDAERSGVRARVFCASLADVFEDWKGNILTHDGQVAKYADGWGPVGIGRDTDLQTHEARRLATMDDARAKLFKLIDETPHLDWLLLTKRPENIRRMMFDPDTLDGWVHRSNLWLGTSIATQPDAFKNVPELLECENIASVLFLSMEPLLEFVSLSDEWLSRLDWVIVGGESGHDSRPMRIELPRSLRDQCVKAGVAFHFKQWGEWAPFSQLPDETFQAVDLDKVACNVIGEHSMHRVGKKLAGRMLDGRTWDEFPAVKVPVSV